MKISCFMRLLPQSQDSQLKVLKIEKVVKKKKKKICFNMTQIAKLVIGLHKGKIYFRWNDASN